MGDKEDSTKMTIRLATASVFAAIVCVVTMVFFIVVPATNGYFNVGEAVIYIAALLFGPYVGAFAGGVGAAIADMVVSPVFAPGTLVIKGFEGAIVGFLNKKVFPSASKSHWRIYTILLGLALGILLAVIGSVTISGNVELYLGFPPQENPTFVVYVPSEAWYFLGGVVALLIAVIGFKVEPELGRPIFSVILGGLEMVVGYFLYEQFVLSKPAALVEIPVNIGQMLIGLVVAIPIVKIVWRSLPQLKK